MARTRSIDLGGRRLALRLTRRAQEALDGRRRPLYVDMELLFSCLVRKRVLFHDAPAGEGYVEVMPGLALRFLPVTARACPVDEALARGGQELVPLPGARAAGLTPRFLELDHGSRGWSGRFGYTGPGALSDSNARE